MQHFRLSLINVIYSKAAWGATTARLCLMVQPSPAPSHPVPTQLLVVVINSLLEHSQGTEIMHMKGGYKFTSVGNFSTPLNSD
jgi:hypothetical protein